VCPNDRGGDRRGRADKWGTAERIRRIGLSSFSTSAFAIRPLSPSTCAMRSSLHAVRSPQFAEKLFRPHLLSRSEGRRVVHQLAQATFAGLTPISPSPPATLISLSVQLNLGNRPLLGRRAWADDH